MRVRFSIKGLMAAVVAAAVVLTAWVNASELWANVVFNLTVLVLVTAAWKARWARGSRGVWWFGFALIGWAHLVMGISSHSIMLLDLRVVTISGLKRVLHWSPEILGPRDAGVAADSWGPCPLPLGEGGRRPGEGRLAEAVEALTQPSPPGRGRQKAPQESAVTPRDAARQDRPLALYYVLENLLTLAVAVVGGWIAVLLASRRGLLDDERREGE